MSQKCSTPDDFFTSEFGKGELSIRLWRGGLRADENGYELTSSVRTLTNSLKDGLELCPTDGVVEKIIDEIEKCWNDVGRMKRACQVLNNQKLDHTVLSVSLARIFLSIDLFQPHMVTCIVNKISEMGDESNNNQDMATLLLNQLRWLDFIVDGKALCESLLAVVPIISSNMQRNVIEALPELIDDSCRDSVVEELVKLIEENPSMMGSVVDAFAALGVNNDRVTEVNSSILSSLAAANRDTLPVSLKFLLRTCPPTLMTQTINAMRNTLALPSLGPGIGRLCFDAVRAGLRLSKPLADNAIKVLRNIERPSEHKPADLWIILALLDSPTHRKPAQMTFKKKGSSRCFSRAAIDAALAPFVDAFYNLTDRLIELASVVFKTNDIGARKTGIELYAVIFRLFSHGNTRRALVTSLLDHAGTRREGEVDAALEALVMIATENESDRSLLPHSAYIQGLLDFVEFFTDSQLRQIWTVLGYLCRASTKKQTTRADQNNESGNDKTDPQSHDEDRSDSELPLLEILLRKELTHPETFYRRIGVLGACTMLKVLGNGVKNNILEMVLEIGRTQPFTQALTFDELAQIFRQRDPLTKETAESIRKRVSLQFEKRYISDCDGLGGLIKDEALVPAKLFGNLEADDTEFCFSISTIIRKESSLRESQDAIRSMVPNLRLLCVLTANLFDGSLSEVDAVVGAPLHLPFLSPDRDLDSITMKGREDLLLSLFVAHGWFVELINAFATQENTELRAKCIRRIDNLLEIRSQISACISQVPLWEHVIYDSYNGVNASTGSNSNGVIHQPQSKGKKRGRQSNEASTSSHDSVRSGDEWMKWTRQLDYKALSLIRVTTPVTWRMTETESEIARQGPPTISSASMSTNALHFLLKELYSHTGTLVNGHFRNENSFTTLVSQTLGTGMKKISERGRISDTSTTSCVEAFHNLKWSLTALGPQLARCFEKIFPAEDDENAPDEVEMELYRRCITLCLRCIATVLNSFALSDPAAQELLFDILASLRIDGEPPSAPSDPFSDADIYAAAKFAFEQYSKKFNEVLSTQEGLRELNETLRQPAKLDMECCCSFLSVMESILVHCSERQKLMLGEKFSALALTMLKYPWDISTLKNRKTQKMIPGIVRIYVQNNSDPIKTAERLRNYVTREFEKASASSRQQENVANEEKSQLSSQGHDIGTLTPRTSLPYAVAVLEQYLTLFKSFSPSKFEKPEDALDRMICLIGAELPLYSLGKLNQKALGAIMRAGRTLVEVFLKVFLPFLKQQFKEHRTIIVQICKMHQKPTRMLQTFCAHSKSTRDTSLTGLVPPLRKVLELLLYRVKDLLQANDEMSAFQLGNLKNRDINGEVLSSQHFQYNSESDDGSQYNSQEDTDDDNDEQAENSEESEDKTKVIKSRNGSQRSKAPQKRIKFREAKGSKSLSAEDRQEPQALDFGSDGEDSDSEKQPLRKRRQQNKGISATRDRYAVPKHRNPPRKRSKHYDDNEESNTAIRRNPLFDDEADVAGADEEEEEQDGGEDLSQFLVFDEEEEE